MTAKDKQVLFNRIIEGSKGSIFRICTAYLSDRDDRDDLYQEILIAIWSSMDRFKGQSQWNTYIYRIAVNTAIKFRLNLKKAQSQIEVGELPEIPEESINSTEPLINKMMQCIKQMRDDDRILLGLLLENLSYKEIAAVLQIDVNYVGVKINRAKKKLMDLMNEENG